jgi:hypothetical protein
MENYTVTQSFGTEKYTDQDQSKTQSFSNKEDAQKYFDEIKNEMQQGGEVITDLWKKDEVIDSFYKTFDNSDNYGKLVIAFQHVGKGMNYAHHFQELFWLDQYNEKNISDNPDYRFKTWHYILDLKKEDLNGLTYDEIFDKIKDEARLKLENSISLQGLELEIKDDED